MTLLADFDWNAFVTSGSGAPVLVFGTLAFFGTVAVIAVQWRKVRVTELETMLKAKMIDRGFAADEIRSTLEARCDASVRRRGVDGSKADASPACC